MNKILILFLIPFVTAQTSNGFGPSGGGPVFSKCGNNLCYDVKISKLIVQMGPDGTNDDVSAKICSDDKTTCCETPALKSFLSNDWSKNDQETWEPKYFGPCKDMTFKIYKGLELTLNKTGTDSLAVRSLFIEAEIINGEGKKEDERFECGDYNFGGQNGTNSTTINKFCKTSPYIYERLQEVQVTVGPDGTKDNVSIEICSDVNNVCCKSKMRRIILDAFVGNQVETWSEGDLTDCRAMQYKISSAKGAPQITLSKDGKDDLHIKELEIDTRAANGDNYRYNCGEFKLGQNGIACGPGQCQLTKVCTKTKITDANRRTTTKKPTTRPPFRLG